jgi:hypothetical protein
MKLTQILAIAALMNVDSQQVAAVRRHHHHHHHSRPRFVQLAKGDDLLQKDPKFAEMQKKKVEIQNAIEEVTEDKPLSEEEEKAKLDKEINSLAKEGDKVAAQAKLKDAKKSLKLLEQEEKADDTPQTQKKLELEKVVAKNEAELNKAKSDISEEDNKNEEKKETEAKVKELKEQLKAIDDKQGGEVKALENVRAKISSIVDEKKEPEADPIKNPKPKADLSAFQANMAKITKEEEEKENIIEAKKATQAAFPKNPVVEAAEAAQEEHEAAMKAQFAAEKAAEEAAEEAAKAEKAAKAKAMAARDATIAGNAELWTANMPEHVINSFLQTKVDEIRYQLAQVEARDQQSDSDSDSDSGSDSD